MTIDQFTKSSAPVTVIVNIANPVAVKLIKILLDQGSRLLIVDKLTKSKRQLLGNLLTHADCLFMDSESTFKNIQKFKKIDYVYYFLSQITAGSTYPEVFAETMDVQKLDHREFMRESNRIDAYLKLAQSFDSSFTLVTSAYLSQFLELLPEANLQLQKYAESLALDAVQQSNLMGRIVRLGELIGRDSDVASPTYFARLLREVLVRKKLNVFADGMQQNYLIHTEDAVYAVLKAAFSPETKGKTYLAAYPQPFTSLGIAYQLLELTQEEKQVVFNEVLPHYNEIAGLKTLCLAPSLGSVGWETQIPFEQAVAETTHALAQQLHVEWKALGSKAALLDREDEEVLDKPTKTSSFSFEQASVSLYQFFIAQPILWLVSLLKPKQISNKRKQTRSGVGKILFGGVIALIVAVILTPYIHFGVSSFKVWSLVTAMKRDIGALQSDQFDRYSQELPALLEGMVSDYRAVAYLQHIPGVTQVYEDVGNILYGGQSLAYSASATFSSLRPALGIVDGLKNLSPNNPAGTVSRDYYQDIGQMISHRSALIQAVQDAKIGNSRLQRIEISRYPLGVQQQLLQVQHVARSYSQTLEEVTRVYDIVPYLLGYKERTNYFLMIQNETELRSTGGWFTHYAIVGIENGQVRELVVNDVYDFDGKAAGIPAPPAMQSGLDVKTMKLALSNWDPSLRVTSETVETLFAQQGLMKKNDVTVTITFDLVKKLLAVVGSVSVDSLGEVTADNLYEKVGVLHGQFVPGSQQKNTVVSEFMPKFMESLMTSSIEQKQQILVVLGNAIEERSVMVYSTNARVMQALLTPHQTYREIKPEDSPIAIIDWNWGGNKANQFMKRSTDYLINERDGKMTITLLYTNESKTDTYPEGRYVNVQRLYYPKNFTLRSLVGYATQAKQFTTEQGLPYFVAEMRVDKQETKPVSIELDMKSLPNSLTLYKQPGIGVEANRVIITRAADSTISEDMLRQQGFTAVDDKWVKTFVSKSDVVVRFR